MKVNLGTLEVDATDRKIIGINKLASREEVRDWAFQLMIGTLIEAKGQILPPGFAYRFRGKRP
jgi:hypothetical protein